MAKSKKQIINTCTRNVNEKVTITKEEEESLKTFAQIIVAQLMQEENTKQIVSPPKESEIK